MELIEKILKKENIEAKKIEKSESGFTNQVYFADGFVVKISSNENTKAKLLKEISIYKNINLNFIPKFVSCGEIENNIYLIISKLKGNPLFSFWHTLNKSKQIEIMSKIIQKLKKFNNLSGDFLNEKYKFLNWIDFMNNQLMQKQIDLKNMGFDTKVLYNIINKKLKIIFQENKFCLIFNDSHFDNFIYDGENVYMIDFDRVIFAPIDYEMLIFKTMCDFPDKFASEKDYKNCKIEDYCWIYDQIKWEYPEIFEHKYYEERIKLYQFNYLIEQAINENNKSLILNLLLQLEKM